MKDCTNTIKQDSAADIYVTQSLKDSSYNGGWNSIGNGNTRTRMYIEKNGVTITLDDTDIVNILKSLAPFDGRL